MFSSGPISSLPLSTSSSQDYSGAELFTFTLKVNAVILFTLKLL